jgi:hypothetical protein
MLFVQYRFYKVDHFGSFVSAAPCARSGRHLLKLGRIGSRSAPMLGLRTNYLVNDEIWFPDSKTLVPD